MVLGMTMGLTAVPLRSQDSALVPANVNPQRANAGIGRGRRGGAAARTGSSSGIPVAYFVALLVFAAAVDFADLLVLEAPCDLAVLVDLAA